MTSSTPSPQRATLREVAERAGVSLKTVTNVVHGRDNVRASTRERVQAAIAELGYRPNLSARNLALGRAGTIALVVPQLDMPYFASLARHVLAEAERHGWFVLIVQTDGDVELERSLLGGSFPQRLDGVILRPSGLSPEEIRDRGDTTPLVLVGDTPYPGVADHVSIDNAAAAHAVVDHLVTSGRRRIAMIGSRLETAVDLRRDGYLAGLADHGHELDPALVIGVTANTGEDGAAAMAALLDLPDPPDAVFCATDWLALGAIRTLATQGLRVPEDVAVVGFDDIPYGRVSTPTLTTVASARDEIARAAVDSLLRQQHAVGAPAEIPASFELIVRESSAGQPPAGTA